MMLRLEFLLWALLSCLVGMAIQLPVTAADDSPELAAFLKLQADGNHKEAYDGLQQWLLNQRGAASSELVRAYEAAVTCLQQLGRINELDDFREKVVAAHKRDWQLLGSVANSYVTVEHYGYMVAGGFVRGQQRGGGKVVNAAARDRVRALQLYRTAMELIVAGNEKTRGAELLRRFAEAITNSTQSWKLQALSDLAKLPDYEDGWGWAGSTTGAPVDAKDNPVFFGLPKSWEAANNDGERWRWLLETMAVWQPARRNDERLIRAQFLESQFGVQTIAQFGVWLFDRGAGDAASKESVAAKWQVDTLGEDETIARLASGIKRFKLPEEHNFIKLYQQVLDDLKSNQADARGLDAARSLATVFENRRQYPRAAKYWRQAIDRASGDVREQYESRLKQIVGNWGQFENTMSQPAGSGATVDFRFRNARQVEFVAQEVDVAQLLNDVKAYLKSKPKQLQWEQINVADIGYRLLQGDQKKYLGAEVARWKLDLQPRANHFDKRIAVATPLQKAGGYLLKAIVADGNTSEIVVWLSDMAIVRKPMPDKSMYFVADAVSGKPIAKANVEFFGYRQTHQDTNKYEVETKDQAEYTNASGLAYLDAPDESKDPSGREFQWLAIATTKAGGLGYLGFHNVWRAEYYDRQYKEVKTFAITDRPVYRPGQTVNFKFWIREAQYDLDEKTPFAHESFVVEIRNPRNEKVFHETLTSDNYGGIAGKFELPAGAELGEYRLSVVNRGGGVFRVEEYKKPEYEVTVDAPSEPVILGDKISAKIRAKYYFGSPVVNATVKYKVTRTEYTGRWFPPAPWDWLYGPGYWWFANNYRWYPGWNDWGCPRPVSPWIWRPPAPPELVAEREAAIGPDGTVSIEIDTSIAQALHPDQDQRYSIEAEVVDQSRRTIVGTGNVLVSRKPFAVSAWVDRGYYRVGDTITANFAAHRLDGKPVEGDGKLQLFKITYGEAPERKPIETEVHSWNLATNAEGRAEIQIKASEKGQYRLSYRVVDKAKHEVEGGYIFTIIGDGFDGSDFRFNDLEILPDKGEYAPDDKVQLQINTNRSDATVLLFLRPSNGIYLVPQLIHSTGKSTLVDVGVTQQDTPNFFVEAMTVANGRVFTQVREIHIPPVKRILNMEITPSAKEYKPGEHAKVAVKVTDSAGKPFTGSTVITIYDKSLEYISGGSNVVDIKAFFWKWRREHRPFLETNLDRWFANLVPPGQPGMETIGVFGDMIVEEPPSMVEFGTVPGRGRIFGGNRTMLGTITRNAMPSAPMAVSVDAVSGAVEAEDRRPGAGTTEKKAAEWVQPTVRSEFSDTAFWANSLETDKDGVANVELTMPENLTTWRIRAWGLGHGTRVGDASAEVVTRKNVIVRLQAPRFLIERDEAVLSANVHNYLSSAKQVKVHIELEGKALELMTPAEQSIDVPAGGERRIDWRVKASHAGKATIGVFALTDEESDAVRATLPVLIHGMLKTDSFTGVIGPKDRSNRFTFSVPQQREVDQSRLEIRYSPTLAGAMVDALPYLIDYPYGCTEQTLNRFLPAVITQQTLVRMKLDLKALKQKQANRGNQQAGIDVIDADAGKRAVPNPVFDQEKLNRIVKAGVNRLQEMQLADGGWGWFTGWEERSTPHMTATVVHGLQIAKQNEVALVPGVFERGVKWLEQYQAEQVRQLANVDDNGHVIDKNKPSKLQVDNVDALVYMVLADNDQRNDAMRDRLFRDRKHLSVYGLTCYGLALHRQHEPEKLAMVLRNIGQYVVQDNENQTAYLKMPDSNWWYWYGSDIEANAYYLKLLAAADSQNPLGPRLAKYLVNNRKNATYWTNTRDTALAVEALADFIKATQEDKPNVAVEVWIDGQKRKEATINAENLFASDISFVLGGESLAPGRHTVEIRKSGVGSLYWNAYLTNFTLEDDIRHAGLELKVDRHYYKLIAADKSIDVAGSHGQLAQERTEKYDRQEIPNLGMATSGDLIEIELTVDSKNDYEYLIFEDMKAAGCEPVALQSGYNGNGLGAYMELRDDRVSLFVHHLARGRHSVNYRVRAETPGQFSALPTRATAMYAPELRGNSDELKLRINDRPIGDSHANP